ncbi:hypothetical protein JJD41_05575 [Oxynema sp. CENA135]|nr:hypothetical protein [Oxynema sp. CENA135]
MRGRCPSVCGDLSNKFEAIARCARSGDRLATVLVPFTHNNTQGSTSESFPLSTETIWSCTRRLKLFLELSTARSLAPYLLVEEISTEHLGVVGS